MLAQHSIGCWQQCHAGCLGTSLSCQGLHLRSALHTNEACVHDHPQSPTCQVLVTATARNRLAQAAAVSGAVVYNVEQAWAAICIGDLEKALVWETCGGCGGPTATSRAEHNVSQATALMCAGITLEAMGRQDLWRLNITLLKCSVLSL